MVIPSPRLIGRFGPVGRLSSTIGQAPRLGQMTSADSGGRAPTQVSGLAPWPLFKPVGTSSETNKFLELLFPEAKLTSHSFKCTALSWSAKFGLDPHDRSVLGRHADATKDTSAIYSRDLSVKSVTALQKVIDAIHCGTFKPDETRKSYFSNDVVVPSEPLHDLTTPKTESIEIKEDEADCVNLVSEESEGREEVEALLSSQSSSDTSSSGEFDNEAPQVRSKIIKVQTCFKEDAGTAFKHCTSKDGSLCSRFISPCS